MKRRGRGRAGRRRKREAGDDEREEDREDFEVTPKIYEERTPLFSRSIFTKRWSAREKQKQRERERKRKRE